MKKLILILIIFINVIGYASGENNKNEFYFYKEPYINPRIIEDMATWISDGGDQVVAINLNTTQESDRYYGDYNIRKVDDDFPYVEFEREEGYGYFSYKYIGKLSSGVEVIETFSNGGGTFTSRNLIFISFLKDKGITFDTENQKIIDSKERTLISRLGSVSSYKYKDIKIINGKLHMGRVSLKDSNLSKKEMEKKLNSLKKEIDNESIKFYNEGILRIGYQEEFNKQSEELLKAVYSNYMKNLKTNDEKNKLKSSQKKWLKERIDFRKQIAIDALYDPTIPRDEQEVDIEDADYDILGLENEYVYLKEDSLIILDRVEVLIKDQK